MRSKVWFGLFVISALCNLVMFAPTVLRNVFAVPVPDNGSWGYISTNPLFTAATIRAMALVGDKPLCTADSATHPALQRFLFADGRLFNTDDNTAFIEELGGAKAFYARVSSDPKEDAEALASAYRSEGFNATVVEHYDKEMKGKMFFVSFRDSKYNPGWVPAFRLPGRQLAATRRWEESYQSTP